jgi:hypothetical protein
MSYIENTFYISSKDEDKTGLTMMINQSDELDDLAEKLVESTLHENAKFIVTKSGSSKARFVDLINAVTATYAIIQQANGRPVFLVKDHYENPTGYYFFIGSHDEIKQKLQELSRVECNLKKNRYSC